MEYNTEKLYFDIETDFENAKARRRESFVSYETAKAKFWVILIARRNAGENMTSPDMKALVQAAHDDEGEIQKTYLAFVHDDHLYRSSKVKYEEAKRQYWDNKIIK